MRWLALITEQDLEQAIAECQGQRNPNANTCLKLASYYTIRREMFGSPSYSYAPPPTQTETIIDYNSGTEFGERISGQEAGRVWKIMDELMSVLQAVNKRLYNGVMENLR